jgi:hypothetical protein
VAIPNRFMIGSKLRTISGNISYAQAIPPHVQLIQMATGCWISQFVSTAANLCVADHLAGGPKSAGEIAEAVRCNPSVYAGAGEFRHRDERRGAEVRAHSAWRSVV